MDIEEQIKITLGKAVEIHKQFGPGLVERFYEVLLYRELKRSGLRVSRQVPVSLEYKGELHSNIFRMDILLDRTAIIEIKSSRYMSPLFCQQLLTYLKASNLQIGIVLNFGQLRMKDGIKRVVNGYKQTVDDSLSNI
ncbi:MAG: GxxExxY protein [Leptospira sp.]|nr:GxxExxY protein [Leptospira sp.]